MCVLLLLLADITVADSSANLFLREAKMAARFGDSFDPRQLNPQHLGFRIDVYHSDNEWDLFAGEDNAACCEEPDYVKPPRWEKGVLRLQQAEGRAFYGCPRNQERQNREIVIIDKGDHYDVTLCGRHHRMARSMSWYERYDQWSRATANQIMGGDFGCKTAAVECDQKRLAALCPLPFDYRMLLEPGHPAQMVPPSPSDVFEVLVADDDAPSVFCIQTSNFGR